MRYHVATLMLLASSAFGFAEESATQPTTTQPATTHPAKRAVPATRPAVSVDEAIDRGLIFLTKDALAWKADHNCASCHHASLVIWSMHEAKRGGYTVDEPLLAELTKWVAESGDGKVNQTRP